jgi:glycosyltransferase involved in cell wall biosynthesis
MQPVVSVVIPCYGQAHFLAEAIESVFWQQYPAIELIVVNDGAPDTALLEEVIAPFRARLDYVRQENQGLSAARNAGLSRARGEFIVFLDADDRLLPNALGAGVAALVSHPECGLVWGLRHVIDAGGNYLRRDVGRISPTERYVDLLRTNIVGPPVGVTWRRSMLEAIGGFAETLRCGEDYDAYLGVAWTNGIHLHGETVAEYRVHSANMSSHAERMFAAVQEVYTRQEARVGSDAVMRRALRAGRRDIRYRYIWMPLLDRLHDEVVARRWWRATMLSARLLVQYPTRFAPILLRHLPRVAGLIAGRRRDDAAASQRPISSGITAPSTPVISTPSSAEKVGAMSSVDTIRSS